MASSQNNLLKDKRFYPLFIVQACGAFNDNLLKQSVVMLVTYKAIFETNIAPQVLNALAGSIFILPFVLFAGIAGQIADKYDKAKIVQILKFIEIITVSLSIYGFYNNNLAMLFICIALMGIHSTFFGPIRHGIIPQHLERDELIAANGYIEASTFISILTGTLMGSLVLSGVNLVLIIMIVIAIVGFYFSLKILPAPGTIDLKINPNIFGEMKSILSYSGKKKQVFLAMLGISWFWFIGAAFLSQIPTLTKQVFWSNEYVTNFFLAIFSVGVGIGSFLCNKIIGNKIQTKYVFLSSIMISILGIDLFFACRISEVNLHTEELRTLSMFFFKDNVLKWYNLRVIFDLFFISIFSGFYIIPLYTVIQCFTTPSHMSRVMSANNLMNSIFMMGSFLLITVLFNVGCSIKTIIFVIFLLNLIVSSYIYNMIEENEIIPEPLLRRIFKFFFDLMYRVEVRGLENFEKAGPRSVIIANHVSYLEPPLLAVYLPERLIFAINTYVAREWWLKPLLKVVKTYPLDPTNPMAIKNLILEVRKNKKIAIFPEGRRSRTGSLMKIYEGPGMVADMGDATILPIRIDGAQYTIFASVKHAIKHKHFPKIVITIQPPVKLAAPSELSSIDRRKYLSQKLYNIMSEMMFETSDYKKTIFKSLLDSSKTFGRKFPILMDMENYSINYGSMITKSFVLGGLFAKFTAEKEHVALMLPNSAATVISFFAMQAYDRVPAMINFTAGAANIISACKTALVKTLVTSRRFIEKADLSEVIHKIKEAHIKVVYLEDLRSKITLFDKLKGAFATVFPETYFKAINKKQKKEDLAVILFTSGTEGNPKAVAISHLNIQSNTHQMLARVDIATTDIAFNALPMFHSFGLMAGTIMPMLSGVKTFFYPSPLHYKIIPEVIYDIGATLLLGTDTFINGYAKYADPYDFYAVRYVFAGAEKLKYETRKLCAEKFGVRIFEGYGVTEASPVVAVNTPMHDKPGSVGRFLPKIEHAILPVEGISEGGRLCIKGPNIMMGYIHANNPGVIVPTEHEKLGDGWYDTGDIVKVDDDGYVTIQGRAKRFAKIAGEMISLTSVEDIANQIDSTNIHAAVHIEDENQKEVIILYTESKLITRDSFLEMVQKNGHSKLTVPKVFHYLNPIPILSTGKINYRSLLELAKEKG